MAEADAPGDDLAAAFEDAFARLRNQVEAVCADADRCEGPIRTAVGVKAVFAFAVADPDAARLLTSEALGGGEDGRARYQRMISYFAGLLCSARHAGCDQGSHRPIAEHAMAGGVALLVGRRLANDRESELPTVAFEAAQFVLTPWVGSERARQIANEHC